MSGGSRAPRDERELDELLSRPRDATIQALRQAPGDVVILGAGGKMGPTLARMAARAAAECEGDKRRIVAVSRFADARVAAELRGAGVETVSADLLDPDSAARLPDAPNVIFMAGQKFGTADAPARTWMMNVVVPAFCARRYAGARIVAFSTGNVYPLVPVLSPGAAETTPPAPVGEYAASCLGRERVFEHHARAYGTRVAIMRLNYAVDLRYGVLTDLALRIMSRTPVPLAMGYVNLIWQGDANRAALEMLPRANATPFVLNVTGGETLSVRTLATELGNRMGVPPAFEGTEASDALLSDTSLFRSLLGDPEVSLESMLDWTAEWIVSGRPTLGKPTRFEMREGTF